MSSSNQNKPGGKPGQRNRKPEQARSQKPEQLQSPKPEQQQSLEPQQLQRLRPEQQQSPEPKQPQNGNKPIDATVASANTLSIDIQAIATAYGDYTRKSFEQTKCFVEKLSGVRSLDKAIEIQTEFAKQAYETFVAESQKIRELYSELAKQTFKPRAGLVANTTLAAR